MLRFGYKQSKLLFYITNDLVFTFDYSCTSEDYSDKDEFSFEKYETVTLGIGDHDSSDSSDHDSSDHEFDSELDEYVY